MNHCAKASCYGRSPIASATAIENEYGTTQILLHCKSRYRESRVSRRGLAVKPFALIASETGLESVSSSLKKSKSNEGIKST